MKKELEKELGITSCDFCTDGVCEYCRVRELTSLQKELISNIYNRAIEDCKEVVRRLWIEGYLLPTIASKIYGELDKLKEPENEHSNVSKQKTSNV